MAEEMPGHIHLKTEKEGSKEGKLKTEDDNVAAMGDSAGIEAEHEHVLCLLLSWSGSHHSL